MSGRWREWDTGQRGPGVPTHLPACAVPFPLRGISLPDLCMAPISGRPSPYPTPHLVFSLVASVLGSPGPPPGSVVN